MPDGLPDVTAFELTAARSVIEAETAALAARGDAVEGERWSRALTAAVDGAEGLVTVEPGDDGRVAVAVAAGRDCPPSSASR